MGFFSWLCPGCSHPLLSPGATNKTNHWMSDCVAVFESGDVVSGTYNGYGCIKGIQFCNDYNDPKSDMTYAEEDMGDPVQFWHRACWRSKGKPDYQGPSAHAPDQGWFFDEGEHDMEKPDEELEKTVSGPPRTQGL